MKKIVTFILLISMVITLAACGDNAKKENTAPKITAQEVYNAGKNMNALLGNHENVYLVVKTNGKVVREEFWGKDAYYCFYDEEYMDIGMDNSSFITDHSEYYYIDNEYGRNVTLTKDGLMDLKDAFSVVGEVAFISNKIVDSATATIKEENGVIIATCVTNEEELTEIGYENMASCVETYTLDAKTREMISIKTVYTYKDGKVAEGIVTITRDVEIPEGMKEFVKLENETENLRTVTIVSNPGADNEKTETVKVAKGISVDLTPDFMVEQTFTIYADAACTQSMEEISDVDSDITVYIKWNE